MSQLKFFLRRKFLTLIFTLAQVGFVYGQTSTFTYQGRFTDGGTAANGTYDMQFKLFDEAGTQIGSTITNTAVLVTNGVFTVQLDYGAAGFPGANRFLEIGVRLAGGGESYTVLSPRQQLTATPYAIRSATTTKADSATKADFATMADTATKADTATSATNAAQLGGVAANQYITTNDSRLIDARTPMAGSSNYIQNTNSQQPANFNINGSGSAAGMLSANVITSATQYNIGGQRFLSGALGHNTYVGIDSGPAGGLGVNNSFYGYRSGLNNLSNGNSFFGSFAGSDNTTGGGNSFFGADAGAQNTLGRYNAFFGAQSGSGNETGNENAFFGNSAGSINKSGSRNSFFGYSAGQFNNAASDNSFFGHFAGIENKTGELNSFFGSGAGQTNSSGGFNSFFGGNAGHANNNGAQNSFFGRGAGESNVSGNSNSFFGEKAGFTNTTGGGNTFLGRQAGDSNTTGKSNTLIGHLADVGANNLDHATAIGADAVVGSSNEIVLGRADGSDEVRMWGTFRLAKLGSAGSVSLCRNSFSFHISTCSSSLRYKTNIQPFIDGLALINRLRPITFDWKEGGMHDVGFGAEEVAAVEPLLVTLNDKGEVEGVKYDRISVALVNAVKEQQEQIKRQQNEIASLKRLVCRRHERAAVCNWHPGDGSRKAITGCESE